MREDPQEPNRTEKPKCWLAPRYLTRLAAMLPATAMVSLWPIIMTDKCFLKAFRAIVLPADPLSSSIRNGNDTSVFAFNPVDSGGAPQDFAPGSTVTNAQYVRIDVDANDNGNAPCGDRAGLVEFQFNPVPGPSSTALPRPGGIAPLLRRRK